MTSRRVLTHLLPALLLTLLAYALSYPAFLMCQYGYRRPVLTSGEGCSLVDLDDPYVSTNSHAFFVPLEYLLDTTPAYKPMLLWAKCFGTAEKMRYDSINRRILRRLGIPVGRPVAVRGSDYLNSSSQTETWASLLEKRKRRMIPSGTASSDQR